MPDGYKCDRCNDFTEVGRFGQPMTENGATHRVTVHEPHQNDSDFSVNDYTLCDRCRDELTNWVEKYE